MKKVKNARTPDSKKYCKDCKDFMALDDGTLTKDHNYCNLSTLCRQVGKHKGKWVNMANNYLPVLNSEGEMEWEYYCTGMYDLREKGEQKEGDDKVS